MNYSRIETNGSNARESARAQTVRTKRALARPARAQLFKRARAIIRAFAGLLSARRDASRLAPTATDRDATCLHVECNAIRKAMCVDGRCQCPPERCGRDSSNRSLLATALERPTKPTRPDPRCSDMGDPHAPFGVSVGAQTQATRGAPHMARPIVR